MKDLRVSARGDSGEGAGACVYIPLLSAISAPRVKKARSSARARTVNSTIGSRIAHRMGAAAGGNMLPAAIPAAMPAVYDALTHSSFMLLRSSELSVYRNNTRLPEGM